jgi:hypothetical protein
MLRLNIIDDDGGDTDDYNDDTDGDEVDSDDEIADEVIQKSVDSFWGGKFVPTPVVKALGYDS